MSRPNYRLSVENSDPSFKNVTGEFILDTDTDLIDNANLGKTHQTCKICGASGDFQSWRCKEMMYGLHDEFNYFECPHCGCLQIGSIPNEMDKYYPSAYYSFTAPKMEPPKPGIAADKRMILDVGCGAGEWLCYLHSIGSVNLYGCDPFIKKDITYVNGVTIRKCTIHEMEGEYDVIHIMNSFEHMPDPHEVFASIGRLLKRGKGEFAEPPKVQIEIPVFPNIAFDIYGPYWYQLDAPRHFFLHSKESMKLLADEAGLKIKSVEYLKDNEGQFRVSRMYQLGVPFDSVKNEIETNAKYASVKNQEPLFKALGQSAIAAKYSDHALFTLVRKEEE